MELFSLLLPEIVVTAAALVLFMFGIVRGPSGRKAAPFVALIGLVGGFIVALFQMAHTRDVPDWTGSVLAGAMAGYVNLLACGVGIFFVLLSWPTNRDGTGNEGLHYGVDAGEYFGLVLLSIVGIMLVGSANDTILLFMGLELASIPTYVLVSMSRPLPAAQEAGVKYFYLGAMSAAVMLMGFAYLYGVTGTTNLMEVGQVLRGELPGVGVGDAVALGGASWQILAVALLLLGFAFKLAAVPLHFYAGDVYTGAGTPVTALLSFVPKATGIIATVKVLWAVGGNGVGLPPVIWYLLFALAVLTMTFGNILALLTDNLKRVMAYSSIAHSGYMLVAITALAAVGPTLGATGGAANSLVPQLAIEGVLFYLAAYGIMNAGVFGVLLALPTRQRLRDADGNERRPPATSAETYDDIAGAVRRYPLLTLAMAICLISLIGIPLTVGFLGKVYVLRPVLDLAGAAGLGDGTRMALYVLIGLTVLNAAIGAAYYLRIIAAMTLQPSPEEEDALAEGRPYEPAPVGRRPLSISTAIALSAVGAILFGTILPLTGTLGTWTQDAARGLIQSESATRLDAEQRREAVDAAAGRAPATLGAAISRPADR